jgi:ribosomal protein S8E
VKLKPIGKIIGMKNGEQRTKISMHGPGKKHISKKKKKMLMDRKMTLGEEKSKLDEITGPTLNQPKI